MKAEINKFIEVANASSLPEMINDNFVKPYFQEKKISVRFAGNGKGNFGKWAVRFSDDYGMLDIDPFGIYSFSKTLKDSEKKIKNTGIKNDFSQFRLFSFYREVSKLPVQYLLFLAVLQEISVATRVFAVENDGSPTNEKNTPYFPLLWALKQFEEFYQKMQNRNLRSDYGVIWHEGEWVDDK